MTNEWSDEAALAALAKIVQTEGPARNELLSLALERLPEGVLITELAEHRILFANEAFCRMSGYALHELVGRTPRMLQGPRTDRDALELLKKELAASGRAHARVVNYTKLGEPYWTELAISTIQADGGELRIAVQREATETMANQTELDQGRARLGSIIEAAPYSIVCYDASLTCRLANPVAARRFGLTPREMIGKHILELLPPYRVGPAIEKMTQALQGEEMSYDSRWFGPDGKEMILHYRIVPEIDPETRAVTGLIVMASDVTRLTQMIEDRTRDLTQALDSLRATQGSLLAKERLATLGELFSGFVHEINNPLGNGKLVMSSMLVDAQRLMALLAAPVEDKKATRAIAARLSKGLTLANQVFEEVSGVVGEFELIGRGRDEDRPKPVRLKEVLEWVVTTSQVSAGAGAPAVLVEVDDELVVVASKHALQEAIERLVDNAYRHAHAGRVALGQTAARIVVRAAVEGPLVVVAVVDDGPGIPAELKEKVFAPFFTTRRGEGFKGLGLHVAQALAVGSLGGDLTLESTPGAGSAFRLAFPVRRRSEDVEPSAPAPAPVDVMRIERLSGSLVEPGST